LKEISNEKINLFNQLVPENGIADWHRMGIKAPSSTWTYLMNDIPFEDMFGVKLIGDIGLAVGAGINGPLVALYPILKKIHAIRQKQKRKL